MINIAPVEALDHELAWETEVLAHTQRLFIDVLCTEVLGDTAVVRIGKLRRVHLIVEQVVHVHIVHIALYRLEVNVLALLLVGVCIVVSSTSRLLVNATLSIRARGYGVVIGLLILLVLVLFLGVVFVGLFEPVMREDLRDRQSLPGIQPNHPFHYSLCVLRQLHWEAKLSLQY